MCVCVCVCVFQYSSPASKVLPSASATHRYLVLWIEYSNFWLVCGENDMYPLSLSLCTLICITTIWCNILIGKTLTSCKQTFNSIRLQKFHIKYFFKIFSFQNCACQGKMSDDWLKWTQGYDGHKCTILRTTILVAMHLSDLDSNRYYISL